MVETYTGRPVSLGDRESYCEDFDNMGKTSDIGKTQDLKSNKSDDISALLHHSKSTSKVHLKRPASDNNGGDIPAKSPCNGQPDKI